jgi:hypothetical protein
MNYVTIAIKPLTRNSLCDPDDFLLARRNLDALVKAFISANASETISSAVLPIYLRFLLPIGVRAGDTRINNATRYPPR